MSTHTETLEALARDERLREISNELAAFADRIDEMALREKAFGVHVSRGCKFCRAETIANKLRELAYLVLP